MVSVFIAEDVVVSSDMYGVTLTFRGADNAILHVDLKADCDAALQQYLRRRSSDQEDEVPPIDRFVGLPPGARRMWVDLPY